MGFQIRTMTAAGWAAANPVLQLGEPAIEADTGILKIGDGTTAYSSLTAITPGAVAGALVAANNLSDLANAATARTNLGLGTAATHANGDYDAAGAAAAAQTAAATDATTKANAAQAAAIAAARRFSVTSTTAVGTAAKTATIGGGYAYTAGDVVYLTLTNGNTAGSPTLNIDGLGAKSIFLGGAAVNSTNGASLAGVVWTLIYDGTQWHLSGVPANYAPTTQAEAEAGSVTTVRWFTPAQVAQAIRALSDQTSTTAALAAIGNAVNTSGKYAGKHYFNTTTNKPVYATGSTAGSVWVDATGATVHTPV